ncbi:hypothetical protein CHS0354_037900 [Potamilus streckersoni]|uniref:KY-like immunoglobulin-like domain-containing protein n=1 Tax=Potamilus streckersoni TaxID=2493646 RepID=A0AAE0WAA3_9BIVA|nr:hypothetical protein CHS0354_037900 [Potamilus streckersoni]
MGVCFRKVSNKTQASEKEHKETEENTGNNIGLEDEAEFASDFLQEIIIEEPINVPVSLSVYKHPFPPLNKKEDIFNKEDYSTIDNKAKNVSDEKAYSYQELIDTLINGLETDLQKLRAIFIWLGQQDIENGDYSKVTSNDTPKGYMKLMMQKKGTYASFFTLLCRYAGLHCVVIKGKGKSICYQVGMTEEECQSLHNTWNAVLVEGCWRLVFPLWAYRAIVGYAEEDFVKVEEGGHAVRERKRALPGKSVRRLNEYYFLTNPEELIFMCFPDEIEWQLLESPWTLQMFLDVPYCEQSFFEEKVEITSKRTCRLHTVDGECTVSVRGNKKTSFTYILYYNEKESKEPISDNPQLHRYVCMSYNESEVQFKVRFPQAGIYKFQVAGGRNRSNLYLCSFKIFCKEAKENCQPLPVTPSIGFGPTYEMENTGIKAISHKSGIVPIKACKELTLSFSMERKVHIVTTLLHNTIKTEESQYWIWQTVTKEIITVGVRVIERGEYALRMFVKQDDSTEKLKNICNYLLSAEMGKRKKSWENAEEKITRNKMNDFAKTDNLDDLEYAIDKFQDLDLEDKGDLTKAIAALEIGRAKRALKDAHNRSRTDVLERAILQAKTSRFRQTLQNAISRSERMLVYLKECRGFGDLNTDTISELGNISAPPRIINDVMIATYLLLGEHKDQLQSWERIMQLIRRPGDLLRRVKQFDPTRVSVEIYEDALSLLQPYTKDSASEASPLVGMLYVWAYQTSEKMVHACSSSD